MFKKAILILILATLPWLTGCEATDTGDTATDPEAAQSFFPTLPNYTVQGTESVQDAIVSTLGGASLLTGNPVQAALVQRLDALLDCYRERGALDAKIYTENVTTMTEARVPIAGVLAVINQNRVRENLVSCLLSPMSATPQPCSGSGSFTFQGDTILYIYAASDRPLCDLFQQHMNTFGG